jgi:hypothetical protein
MSEGREEKRSALDEFAKLASAPVAANALTVQNPAEQSHGAIAVAVRRDEAMVLQKLKALAAAAGAEWGYRFPVKNKKENRTDWIEGPSIKLANDLARLYGNCEVDCRATDLGDSWVFHARFVDLETGFALTRPFQQRKSASRIGGDDDARRLDISFQIGASKAIRNVVVNALQTFADFAHEEARGAIVDKIGKDLSNWRERVKERIGAMVALDRVEAIVGRKANEWLAPDVAKILAMGKAVSDGMATIDETFPPLREVEKSEGKTESGLDDFSRAKDRPVQSAGPSADNSAPRPVSVEGGSGGNTTAGDADKPGDKPPADARPAIDAFLKAATDKGLSQAERLQEVNRLINSDDYKALDSDMLKVLAEQAMKVARGESTASAARHVLEALL